MVNEWAATTEKSESYEVVGVVGDTRPVLHEAGARPCVYFPLGQEWRPVSANVLVRGAGDSRSLIPAIKETVSGADSFADVARIRTMAQMMGEILYPRRIAAAILAVSGMIALLLATIGVYGVVSYSVAQRTGEIGVRMALGAERRDILRLVLREGGTVAVLGSVAGLALGYAAIRITSSRYLALPQLDIATVLITPLALVAVVLLACYLPARRAGCVEPMEVLRRP
jgi:predicted lysophospholipase L1 biosynthesis ABC-type transport system permease subunit